MGEFTIERRIRGNKDLTEAISYLTDAMNHQVLDYEDDGGIFYGATCDFTLTNTKRKFHRYYI